MCAAVPVTLVSMSSLCGLILSFLSPSFFPCRFLRARRLCVLSLVARRFHLYLLVHQAGDQAPL